ncbi:hypothetical protein PCL_12205 [Purpureocillium lilacinum]|uniref:Uncharacterized protein n=1 Tax=Purpureocillium lilacinum TaxID=33203 RepID=A0A2U3E8P4_PURLI|nr:hypothetical protein PCL_12205 [Purpureocillium lilacinum]
MPAKPPVVGARCWASAATAAVGRGEAVLIVGRPPAPERSARGDEHEGGMYPSPPFTQRGHGPRDYETPLLVPPAASALSRDPPRLRRRQLGPLGPPVVGARCWASAATAAVGRGEAVLIVGRPPAPERSARGDEHEGEYRHKTEQSQHSTRLAPANATVSPYEEFRPACRCEARNGTVAHRRPHRLTQSRTHTPNTMPWIMLTFKVDVATIQFLRTSLAGNGHVSLAVQYGSKSRRLRACAPRTAHPTLNSLTQLTKLTHMLHTSQKNRGGVTQASQPVRQPASRGSNTGSGQAAAKQQQQKRQPGLAAEAQDTRHGPGERPPAARTMWRRRRLSLSLARPSTACPAMI